MANDATAIKAGRADVEVGTNNKPLITGLGQAASLIKGFAITSIGTTWLNAGKSILSNAHAIATSYMEVASVADALGAKLRLSDEDVQGAKRMKAAYREMNRAIFETKNAIGSALAPAFTLAAKTITACSKPLIGFIKENKGLALAVVGVGTAIAAGGVALVGLGTVITSLSVVCSGLAAAVGFIASPVGLIVVGITAVTAALGVATYAFFRFTKVGNNIADNIGKTFSLIRVHVRDMATGIMDALTGGDASLACEIFWKGFEVAGLKAMKALKNYWKDTGILGTFAATGLLGPLGGFLDFKAKTGKDSALLSLKEKELNELRAKAKAMAKAASGPDLGTTLERLGGASAHTIFSSGYASSIAGAFNQQQDIPKQMLREMQKMNQKLDVANKKKPIQVREKK